MIRAFLIIAVTGFVAWPIVIGLHNHDGEHVAPWYAREAVGPPFEKHCPGFQGCLHGESTH